jgi:Ras-related GTP-binding protein A/B
MSSKTGETWVGFESTFDECRVVLEPMTKNTFGLVISTDPRIGEPAVITS